MKLLNKEKVDEVLDDMKVITAETAFVVRTFFFIIFGWSVYLGSLLSFKVIGIGLVILAVIYIVRAIVLFLFNGRDIITQLFLAPRGLITILLFFAIPVSNDKDFKYLHDKMQAVLLFVILISCLIMTWSMIVSKNKLTEIEEEEEEEEECPCGTDEEGNCLECEEGGEALPEPEEEIEDEGVLLEKKDGEV